MNRRKRFFIYDLGFTIDASDSWIWGYMVELLLCCMGGQGRGIFRHKLHELSLIREGEKRRFRTDLLLSGYATMQLITFPQKFVLIRVNNARLIALRQS